MSSRLAAPVQWASVSLFALACLGGAVFFGSQPGAGAEATGPAATAPAMPGPLSFDLRRVAEEASSGFRETAGGFRAAPPQQAVEVNGGGFVVTPRTERDAVASSVRFATRSVRRGAHALWRDVGATTRSGSHELVTAGAGVTEHLKSTSAGVEQAWAFEAAPAGAGDLVVSVAVDAPLLAATSTGLHFAAGPRAVRYGHATWVDARGTRTPVEATWAAGAIELSVPAEVLAASEFPAVLDPLVSAEVAVDQPVYFATYRPESPPAVAWNGSRYLVVFSLDGDVLGVRLDATGAVLDPAGFLVAPTGSSPSRENPVVASDGVDFFVAWFQSHVFGVRVSASTGETLGLPAQLSDATDPFLNRSDLTIAYGGGSYLLAWTWEVEGNVGVHWACASTLGAQTGSYEDWDVTAIRQTPAVAFDGTNFLIAWHDFRPNSNVYARRVAPVTAVAVGSEFELTNNADVTGPPAMAWNGNRFLVTWPTNRGFPASTQIVAVLVTTSPTVSVLPNATTGQQVTFDIGLKSYPAATAFGTSSGGTTFLLAWKQDTAIRGARVTTSGTVTDTTSVVLTSGTGAREFPALVGTASTAYLTWQDGRSGPWDIWARTVSPTLALGSETLLSRTAPRQEAPSVAWSGSSYLLVWEDTRATDGTSNILGVRLSSTGTVLDSPPLTISGAAGSQEAPDVAWLSAANLFLVTWTDRRSGTADIYGARVSPTGLVHDPAGFAISTAANAQRDPAVASDGTAGLVVWTDERDGGQNIFGALVFADAGVSPPAATGLAISTAINHQASPDLAWNGTNYVVAWEDHRDTNVQANIYAARVSPAGSLLDATGVAVSSLPDDERDVAVAASGATVLVSWKLAPGFVDSEIRARRVTTSPGLTFPEAILTVASDAGTNSGPAVAADGTHFQLTWAGADPDGGIANTILGRRVVVSTGALLDPTPTEISPPDRPFLQRAPAIAASGTRSYLVAYERFDGASTLNSLRVRARTLANAPPVATAQAVSTPEDTARVIALEGTDADGDGLTFTLGTAPTNGSLTWTPPNVTYTPFLNYAGPDAFTFTVSDGLITSSPATVTITVTPVNDAPVAQAQTVSTAEDTARLITLVGSDVDGDPLTYAIVTGATNGTLSAVSGATVTYTPNANYFGPDSFTFRVNDGTVNSAPATVSITVTAVNDAPVANPQSLTLSEDTSVNVVLTGFDVEGSPLTYTVVTNPTNGTLTGTPPNLTYTPAANFAGTDLFTFKVNDGTVDSAPAQVTFTVTPVNDPPVAQNSAVGTARDTPVVITLQASDVDSSALTYIVVTGPTNGTLSGTGASRTYTPSAGYAGNDSFTFKANDGAADSNIATVTISVGATNRAPVATPQTVTTAEDTSRAITLTGTDADGDPLTFSIVTQPTQGTITGTSPTFTYQPASNYNGPDAFTFKANDGSLDSATATVTITVTPVNDAPVANPMSLSVAEDSTLNFTLSGSDVEGSPLSFSVTTQPVNGTLTGTPPMLQYQPNPDFNGSDSLQFTVSDGQLVSAPATVFITVTPVNDAPIALPQSVTTPQDTPRSITLLATDIDSTVLTFTIVTQPTNGTLSGTPPVVTYTPNLNFRGNDTFTFKASDGQQDSAPAAVGISVAAVNRPPVAASQNLTVAEDEPLAVTLTATDPDGDALTYSITVPPMRGTLSGTPPNLTYTPAANANGLDTFVFRANDGTVDSNDGTVRVTVTPVNDPPVASNQQVTTPEDTAVSIVLSATDPDPMDVLTWTIEVPPSHGTMTGNPPNLTYTPSANYSGPDSFTFSVSDGTVSSAPATVTITITPVNDAPVASPVSTSTVEGTPVEVTLSGSDAEDDPLSFAVTVQPAQGTLTGEPPVLVYTPRPGFTGTDSFSYTASDGAATSVAAAVTITVTPAGGGGTSDTTRLNGWSCGCTSGAADAGAWGLGLLALGALRRRRVAPVVAALAVALALPAVAAPRPAARKSATSKKAPAPPAPTPEPAPAPIEPVSAEPPAPVAEVPKGPPSLAALDVLVSVPNEKLDAAAFTEMLTTAVHQSKLFKVISSQDIAIMLGLERQRNLLGCTDDTSCLTEIADALGTSFVMQGTVGRVGDTYLVTVRLIDSKRSRVVGRGVGQTGDANLLLNQIWKSTQEAIDAWGATLPAEEGRQVAARPQVEPLKAVAPARSKLGVIVAVVGGYQPLAPEGSRGSVGGEVAASWRLGRLDLGAGVVISPTPGARIFGMLALTQGQHRFSVGLRASAFFGAAAFGGGPAVEYELGLNETFGLRVLGSGEVYGSQQGVVLALLAGLGASARF